MMALQCARLFTGGSMACLRSRRGLLSLGLLVWLQCGVVMGGHETRAAKEKASMNLRAFLGRLYELELVIAAKHQQGPALPSKQGTPAPEALALIEVTGKAFGTIEASLPPTEAGRLREALAELSKLMSSPTPRFAQAYERALALRHTSWTSLQVDAGPALTPNWQLAQKTYGVHCASCHGADGRGDGVLASKLPVAMSDFTAPAFAAKQAPLMIYNLLLDGKAASPMPAYKTQLSSRELWSLSYYLVALSRGASPDLPAEDKTWLAAHAPSLRFLGQHNDYELRHWIASKRAVAGSGPASCDATCERLTDYLRRTLAFEGAVLR